MVTDKVRLIRPLGTGGMGKIWVAEHLTLCAEVAVKFVPIEQVQEDPTRLSRFMREASMSAQIKSPHVVRTFDHGVTDEGMPYIVMELLEGETLRERIERQGPLTIEQTVELVRQVSRALTGAHRLGIVHRDIKPGNLFLVAPESTSDVDDDSAIHVLDDQFFKVLDFGLAKQHEMAGYSMETTTGAMVGTPAYMSPEQALSRKDVDHHADLWALAVVAYHALTGRPPFRGETLGSLCVAIANADFDLSADGGDDLPPALDRFFQRALHRDIERRFATAAKLCAAFIKAAEGQEVEDKLPVEPEPSSGRSLSPISGASSTDGVTSPVAERSRRVTVGAAVLLLTGVIIAVAIAVGRSGQGGETGQSVVEAAPGEPKASAQPAATNEARMAPSPPAAEPRPPAKPATDDDPPAPPTAAPTAPKGKAGPPAEPGRPKPAPPKTEPPKSGQGDPPTDDERNWGF